MQSIRELSDDQYNQHVYLMELNYLNIFCIQRRAPLPTPKMNTTTTGASEDFIRKFNEELQSGDFLLDAMLQLFNIFEDLSTLLTSPDTKLRLVELEKRLIDACIYLPLYDQKTCNSVSL